MSISIIDNWLTEDSLRN